MSEEEERNASNAWKMLYSLARNIQTHMDVRYEEKNDEISSNDVNKAVNYITTSIDNILRNTIKEK